MPLLAPQPSSDYQQENLIMASESKPKSLSSEEIKAEWANVGLCGGMFRPANGSQQPPKSSAVVNEEDWHPHNRCCH
jgi:hypothetical protein